MDLERSDEVDLGIFHVNAKDLERELGPQYLHCNRQNVLIVEKCTIRIQDFRLIIMQKKCSEEAH